MNTLTYRKQSRKTESWQILRIWGKKDEYDLILKNKVRLILIIKTFYNNQYFVVYRLNTVKIKV